LSTLDSRNVHHRKLSSFRIALQGMAFWAVFVLSSLASATSALGDPVKDAFDEFVVTFNKKYSEDEHDRRFTIFKDNFMFIETENTKGHSYQLGVNEFTDMTSEEFSAERLGFKPSGGLPTLGVHTASSSDLINASVDWRAKGAVTPIKNQMHCGSCWAFSATGALEGAWFLKKGALVSLSEEMIVECDKTAKACAGGDMTQAMQFAEGGVCTEASYPYTCGGKIVGACRANYATNCTVGIPKGGVTGVMAVAKTEAALMSAVAQQPISIGVQANQPVFKHYRGGIMTAACGTALDHGILAVGYGTENGVDYWIVKNSWGTRWGEAGFGRLKRGVPGGGECGILMDAAYPVIAGSEVVV